jgi:hypothetical protein
VYKTKHVFDQVATVQAFHVAALALACWLGERFSGQWVPRVNLRLALDQMRTPRRHGLPDRMARPTPPSRLYADDGAAEDLQEPPTSWDEAKDRLASGTYNPKGRSPWM